MKAGRQLFLVPPHGARIRTTRIRGSVVALLTLTLVGGFAGYFIPFSRFSLDKVKLNERNNLQNVNHDLLRRYIGIRFALDTLRTQTAELVARHGEVASTMASYKRQRLVTSAGMDMGISQLHEVIVGYEQKWGMHVARMDSARTYFEHVPVIVPLRGRAVLSVPFGMRVDPFTNRAKAHNGVDFVAPKGTEIVAAAKGTVSEVRQDEQWGHLVRIRHARGYTTVYAHLGSVSVSRGKSVKRGEVIGTMGSSGRLTTGPHLHYEVHVQGRAVDPLTVMYPPAGGLLFDTAVTQIPMH